jgi:hypothetical protein
MRVVVEFDWEDVGKVSLSTSGKLAFPPTPAEPGVYRFEVTNSGVIEVYIGESENLRQRMEHNYRYHPASTNVRVREMLTEHLMAQRPVALAITRSAKLEIHGDEIDADFGLKQIRLLVENAALATARQAGMQIHNLQALFFGIICRVSARPVLGIRP